MDAPVVLVLLCDNHYAVIVTALLKSLDINERSKETIKIYIIEDEVFRSNKQKLIISAELTSFDFRWLSSVDSVPKNIELPLDNSSWHLNIHGRLFILHFIESDI